MKYFLGVLGLFLGCTYIWATPEMMTMYATLSEPIGSFWSVKTEGTTPVTLPAKSQLNLGVVANATVGSSEGTIQLESKPNSTIKPILTIKELKMEQGTTFEIGNKWFVDTINIGNAGTAQFEGAVVVNQLELSNIVNNLPEGTTTLPINVNYLRLGGQIDTTTAQFAEIGSTSFQFKNTEVPIANVAVNSRYNGEPKADWESGLLFVKTNGSN